MKVKVSNQLRRMLSKHFVTKMLPELAEPIETSKEDVYAYWESCSKEFKLSSLCFFSQDLIDLVNKTNSKLLYAQLLAKASESAKKQRSTSHQGQSSQSSTPDQSARCEQDQDDEGDFSLLNAFEMLWNVESAQALRKL